LRKPEEIAFRVSRKQIDRLMMAADFFANLKKSDVEIRFLFVLEKQFIELNIEDLL
jgi:hypothetical protein